MNIKLCEQLIDQAGFSTTFEQQRLRKLIQLTVMQCANLTGSQQASMNILQTWHLESSDATNHKVKEIP